MSARTAPTRRRFLAGTSAALTLGAASACGSSNGRSADELTMWTFLDPAGPSGREKVLGALIESYTEETGIQVNVEVQQWDTMTQQFLAADVSSSAPDVMWLSLDQVATAVEQGALADLNALAFGDLPEAQLADLRDVYWTTMEQDDGSLYGVVHSRNYFGIMYRADLLAEVGADPADLNAWSDLLSVTKELTSPDDGRWGLGQAFGTSFADPQILSARILELQGSMFAADGSPQWSTDPGVSAMEFQAGFVTDSQVTSHDAVRLTSEDLYELFSAGQAAMINGASVRVPAMQEQIGAENVGFMHYPSGGGVDPAPGSLAGWSVGVWAGSEVAEQAADFVAFLSSPEADARWMLEGQQPPLYASTAADNADFLAAPENSFLATVLEGTQELGWLPPTSAPTVGWREALNGAVQKVLLEQGTAAEAMEAAEQEFGVGGHD
ncbi:ABC transporter substrate-binding protein [Brachybacterium sacelli]|uniref:N,N'-diacetylchitobiose transport system substrate-binding protein n=1 Tax=Brachybacterium sacelli TaxID=173364 RepID=A0ABS4WZ65_9MICO|nr:extracellular solute-binding protein [Brachybacterium sacelli]MBP2381490.1 N,N'-diacetylchitobiose transport system substrate-binding protein [Brachybacterium sacelli]